MGRMVTLEAADGHRLNAWESEGHAHPYALVVVQEIFGVNPHIRAVCDTLAQSGFHVIAPALFDRVEPGLELDYTAEGVKKGLDVRARIPLEKTLLDLEAAIHALAPRKVGMIGYCWGGTLAWQVACRDMGVSAASCWYGAGIAAASALEPRCPVQMHFGGLDVTIPPADIATIRAAHPEIELYVYDDADHGFGCADRATFNAQAYALAQERSLAFLKSSLNP
ncbi:MAG: dienelactone hydrolase family protein [Acetobacter sp.]|uniref:dienelactone hydrolase family protein n=1 Tax=Acetobacter sp. TaxID=440 RepID=UPI0039E8B6BD